MSIDTYISEKDIAKRVKELGQQITKDFAGEELVVVGVLNGSFLFMADLVREIKNSCLCRIYEGLVIWRWYRKHWKS